MAESALSTKPPPQEPYPNFYCTKTGIYSSKHPRVELPEDPFLDVVSFIFSHKHNGQTALIDSSSGSSILYKDLFPMVKSMAYGLQSLGNIKQGDVVLLFLPSSIHYPVVFLSVLYLGAIVSTMNPLSSLEEIRKQVTELRPCMAFTNLESVGKLESLKIPVVCVPGELGSNEERDRFEVFYKLVNGGFDAGLFRKPLIRQEDTAAILYSSGTTGASKGVILTHKTLISMVELMVRNEASLYKDWPSSENTYIATVPMFHIFGIAYFVMGLISLGTCVVVMKRFHPDEAVKVIDRYGVTHLSVVPPMLPSMMRSAKNVGTSLKSLKQICCGAAPLSAKVIQEFLEAYPHVDFIQGFGMTESPGVGARGFNTKKFRKYSSVGLLTANGQAKIVDCATGSFLPPGCSGELCLRGTGVMKGYLNNKEATALAIDEEGWFHTGDIGYIDSDGYLFVVDRLKDTIKYKGFQIAPADLESILMKHPDVLDAAVIGVVDSECGEIPAAFVVRKPGSSLTERDVISYVAAQVTPYKKVRKVVFTQSIPKSAAGKILKRELRNSLSSKL